VISIGKFVDLTGRTFGRLIVLSRDYSRKNKGTYWICQCNCENKTIRSILGSDLTKKNKPTKSCGCWGRECLKKSKRKQNIYDLTGEYGIGYTSKGEEFYFDLEDYDKIKDYCWRLYRNDYIVATNRKVIGGIIWMHRIVLNLPNNKMVDHINHRRWNNRKMNLRECNSSQNNMNRSLGCNNTSGVTGVSWDKKSGYWYARIGLNGKSINLGGFSDFNEAVKVRQNAEIKYFKDFRYQDKKCM
jgi:hypothetical protein